MSSTGTFDFRHHGGFQQSFTHNGVNAGSTVMVSISEVGNVGGQVVPFQGAASLSIDNIVPGNDQSVIVRGNIGWESDLDVRLHVFVA
jgi:hypothetical protein